MCYDMAEDMLNITVDADDLLMFMQRAGNEFPLFVNELKGEIANETKATEKPIMPIKTGELRESTDAFEDRGSIVVGPVAPHAVPVARGTKAHRITPKNKKALAWPGASHPVKSVWHPGTKARPFDLMTMTEMAFKVNPMANVVMDRYLQRWN